MEARRTNKTLVTGVVDGLVVAVCASENASDGEWGAFIELIQAERARRILIDSAGGAPGPMRRLALRYALAPGDVRISVVSDVGEVLWSVSYLALFDDRIRGFRRSALSEALAYLEIHSERHRTITAELQRLRAAVGDVRGEQ